MNNYPTYADKLDYNELQKIVTKTHPQIKVATTDNEVNKILKLRASTYPEVLPELNVDGFEQLDSQSILFYTENTQKNIMSTCRLVIDNSQGFSEESTYQPKLNELRGKGKLVAEWGRVIIEKTSKIRALDYAPVIQAVSEMLNIDSIFMLNRHRDVNRILNTVSGTEVIAETSITFGSQHQFTSMLWTISPQRGTYKKTVWDKYAHSFMTVTTHYQSVLLREAASHLFGEVVDCGAGCAKIAPYLSSNKQVHSYTAIDASNEMCQLGEIILGHVSKKRFRIVESYIEDIDEIEKFDSAVSINSMYTWSEPLLILKHIHSMLKPKGVFVLVTINYHMNMAKLLDNIQADLTGHPHAEAFINMNALITENKNAHIFSLDELITLSHQAGFKVLSCHEKLYEGGLSFLLLEK